MLKKQRNLPYDILHDWESKYHGSQNLITSPIMTEINPQNPDELMTSILVGNQYYQDGKISKNLQSFDLGKIFEIAKNKLQEWVLKLNWKIGFK